MRTPKTSRVEFASEPDPTLAVAGLVKGPPVWLYLVLAALALSPYLQSLSYPFFNVDDGQYVVMNEYVVDGLTLKGMAAVSSKIITANWHPMTWWSLMLDTSLYGVHPWGYRSTNIILHVLNTILVLRFVQELTRDLLRSVIVAALFAVHPQHVESVVWISERKDVLSGFFGILSLWAYTRYARQPSRFRMALVAGLLLLGLMSKQMLVTWPFVFLLLDVWPLCRVTIGSKPLVTLDGCGNLSRPITLWGAIVEKWFLFLMVVTFIVVVVIAQKTGGAVGSLEVYTWPMRLSTVVVSSVRYLRQSFWPTHLCTLYPYVRDGYPPGEIIVSVGILIVLAGAGILLFRRYPSLAIGLAWFFGTLIPVIGIVQIGVQSMADRYMYLPHLGLFLGILWLIPLSRPWQKTTLGVGSALAVAVLAGCTSLQVQCWKSTRTMMEHTILVTELHPFAACEKNPHAHMYLGVALKKEWDAIVKPDVTKGKGQAAIGGEGGAKAIELLDRAEAEFKRAIDLHPKLFRAYVLLADLQYLRGDLESSLENTRKSLEIAPDNPMGCQMMGTHMFARDNFAEAARYYEMAIRGAEVEPPYILLYGIALSRIGQTQKAMIAYKNCIRLDPRMSAAHQNLGALYAEQRDVARAIQHFRAALAVDPGRADSRYSLALSLAHGRLYDEARKEVEILLKRSPDHAAGIELRDSLNKIKSR